MKKKQYVYMLLIEDLSHLGGPMGSEYTTEVSNTPHATPESALAKAKKFYRGTWDKKWDAILKRGTYVDASSYGFKITRTAVK